MKNQSEDKNRNVRTVLRILGFVFLITGIVCVVIGFKNFNNAFTQFPFEPQKPNFQPGNFGPKFEWIIFLGFPLIFVGLVCLGYGYMGKVARYTTGEIDPVAKDNINYLVDGTKDSIVGVVKEFNGKKSFVIIVKN